MAQESKLDRRDFLKKGSAASLAAKIPFPRFSSSENQVSRVEADLEFGNLLPEGFYQDLAVATDFEQIYLLNMNTSEKVSLTDSVARKFSPRICGEAVAWLEREAKPPAGSRDNQLHLFDLSTRSDVFAERSTSTKRDLRFKGDKLLWADSRKGKESGADNLPSNRRDIYWFDLTTGQEQPLVESPFLKRDPDLDGDNLVWSDYRSGLGEVYTKDLKSGQERKLTSTLGRKDRPRIWADQVIWTIQSASDALATDVSNPSQQPVTGVYLMNLRSGQVDRLTDYIEPFAELFDNLVVIGEGNHGLYDRVYGIYLH